MDPGQSPFATPESDLDDRPPPDGSFGLGVALGAILGLWGWIGCLVFAKPATKRGAGYGFLGRVVVTLIAVAVALLIES